MSVDISSLMSEADFWEIAGYVASGTVLLGIVIESYELYKHIRAGMLREKAIEASGLLVVISGLAAEILTQVQSNNRTGIIISALNEQSSDANRRASEATQQAAILGASIDTLQDFVTKKEVAADNDFAQLKTFVTNDTARNEKLISELNESRDRLVKAQNEAEAAADRAEKAATKIAGRTITPEQQKLLIAAWKNLPKGPITVAAKLFDEEAEIFAKQLTEVLSASGFQATLIRGPFSFTFEGQWIVVRDLDKWNKSPSYLGDIQASLRSVLHIEFDGQQMNDTYPKEWGDVGIAIGAKGR
jgi:hypothetical protein